MWVRKNTWESFPMDHIDPKLFNEKEWFEVDDLIAPVIIELNRKEYITRYCCQGHLEMFSEEGEMFADFSTPYIAFANWVKLKDIPAGWKTDDHGTSIYRWDLMPDGSMDNIHKDNIHEYYFMVYDLQIHMFDQMLRWAKSLPKYSLVVDEDNKKIMEFHKLINTPEKYEEFRKEFVGQPENNIVKYARARCCRGVYRNVCELIDACYHGDNVYIYDRLYRDHIKYAMEHRDDPDFQRDMYFKTKMFQPDGEVVEVYL